MKLLVTGATGLLGARLDSALRADGHQVARLTRSPETERDVGWSPSEGRIDGSAFDDVEAVVHLAAENIAAGRWSDERKRRILDSRVEGTALIAESVASSGTVRTLVSASAVGFYGDRDDAVVDESSPAGEGFLADVCQAWEAAAEPARDAGVRVVHPRFGAVLATEGGMLAKMLPAFRFGVGGVVGSGDQWLSWVAIEDAVRAIRHAIDDDTLAGPVNVTAPEPVTNRQLTRALGRALGRPTVFPLPAFLARTVFGELADELLLASTRVRATRLSEAGFSFACPTVESALESALDALLES